MELAENTPPSSYRRDLLLTVAVPVLLLLPFLGKAFHIDDPVYLRVAQHILESPLNFYGFTMNWYGVEQPMYDINQNPPLLSYYLAPFGLLFGWSEWVMHSAMLLPTIAAIAGIFMLARELDAPPRLTAWIAVLNPLFFVSATTVMTDVPMVACWVWAMTTWIWGLETGRTKWFVLSGILIGAAFLFKYFGLSLLPLLAVYTLFRQPKRPFPLLYLLIPMGIVVTYELWCSWLYGQGQFLAAFSFADSYIETQGKNYFLRFVGIGTFLGSCAFFLMASPRQITRINGLVIVALFLLQGFFVSIVSKRDSSTPIDGSIDTSRYEVPNAWIMCGLFGLGAILLLAATREVLRHKDAKRTMLFIWILGTIIFVCFVNHFVNARVLIPLLPAVAIMFAPGVDRDHVNWPIPLLLSVLLALSVAAADNALANSARRAANEIVPYVKETAPEARIWFSGHWGFQWYMEQAGARPLDGNKPDLRPNDVVVEPANNTNIVRVSDQLVILREERSYPAFSVLTTMSRELNAGFYSDVWGIAPFAFGKVPEESYDIQFLGIAEAQSAQ